MLPYIDEIDIALNAGDITTALRIVNENESQHGEEADFISAKAVVCLALGETALAIEVLEKGTVLYPRNFDILYNLGYAMQVDNRPCEAHHWYSIARQCTADYDMLVQLRDICKELESIIAPNCDDVCVTVLDIADVRKHAQIAEIKDEKDMLFALRMLEFGINKDEALNVLQAAIDANIITIKQIREYLNTNGARQIESMSALSRLRPAGRGKADG